MLTHLTGSVIPYIAMAARQSARFSIHPKLSYEKTVMRIGRHLASTSMHSLFFNLDVSKDIEVFVDADFAES